MTEKLDREEILARKADVSRSRLLRIIDVLDRRRHQIASAGKQMGVIAAVGSAVIGLGLVAGAAYFIRKASMRPRVRFFTKQKSLGEEVGERALLAIVSLVIGQGGRIVMQRLMGPKSDDARTLH